MLTKIMPDTEVAFVSDPAWPIGQRDKVVTAENLPYWAYAQLKAAPELARLAKMAAECLDDDLENRPMRHSIGRLHAEITHLLEALETPPKFRRWEQAFDKRQKDQDTSKASE